MTAKHFHGKRHIRARKSVTVGRENRRAQKTMRFNKHLESVWLISEKALTAVLETARAMDEIRKTASAFIPASHIYWVKK